jgi:sugar/nucleoside kinase (ribokinase family)
LIAGQLRREYVILPSNQALLDVPGGNLLYAAVGVAVWEPDPPPAVVARVGEDYPPEWLEDFTRHGLDIRGIRVLPQEVDLRSFVAYSSRSSYSSDDPVTHFARLGMSFPRELLGYRSPANQIDSRTKLLPNTIRQADIPGEFLDASAAHICPLDYLTHTLLPAVLRQAEFTTVTLDPSPGYMNPTYWNEVPALLTGLSAFLPSEEELRSLFQGQSEDLWEMAEAIAAFGCEMVVIKRGEGGQLVYDGSRQARWEVPAYPVHVVDPTGAGDAFCGGFLSGYRQTYDAVEAALFGNISASLVVEGNGPFYALDALPGLAQARKEALRQSVRRL